MDIHLYGEVTEELLIIQDYEKAKKQLFQLTDVLF